MKFDKTIIIVIFSITSDQIISTVGFEFFLSWLSHLLFPARINTNKTLVAEHDVNKFTIFPIYSIPKMLLIK